MNARLALAELKVAANLIPNPTVLINTIPMLEAQASSEIENIVTTADELFRHMDVDDQTDARHARRFGIAEHCWKGLLNACSTPAQD